MHDLVEIVENTRESEVHTFLGIGVYTPLVGGQCAPQYWPMKPSNAHSPRPMNGPRTAASQPVRARDPAGVGGTRHGGRGARGPRQRGMASKPKRASDPHAASPSPSSQSQPPTGIHPTRPSSPKHAPRDSAPPTCRQRPRRSPTYPAPFSHVPLPLRASDWLTRPS
jgi:hypothetical protein